MWSICVKVMEGHSQLANCVRGKTMGMFKPWRYLVSKPPNLDVAKEARILCVPRKQSQNKFIKSSSFSDALLLYSAKVISIAFLDKDHLDSFTTKTLKRKRAVGT